MAGPSGATSRLALPYPTPTDTVDVPRDVQALANRLDTLDALAYTGAPLVTSLPGVPVDGQECYFVADSTNGVIWHLRYRAASTKWEFVGGGELTDEQPAANLTSGPGYIDAVAGGAGPLLTLPLAGDYRIEHACWVWSAATGAALYKMTVKLGAAAASDNECVQFARLPYTPSTVSGTTLARQFRRNGLAAGTVLKAQYAVSAGSAEFGLRTLAARPVRVS